MSSIGLSSIWSSMSSDIAAICVGSCFIPSDLFSSTIFDSLMEQLLNIVESWVTVESLVLKFWEVCVVDGDAVSDADVKTNLVFSIDVDDAVGVIEIVDRCPVIDIPILDKDFDWFGVTVGNEYCSWLKSSLDCHLTTRCPVECRVL